MMKKLLKFINRPPNRFSAYLCQSCVRFCHNTAPRRRVVVTGMGMVCSLGVGVSHVWGKLIGGECGITRLTGKEFEPIPSKVAGVVPRGSSPGELDLDAHISPSDQRTQSLSTSYALVAADEALRQAQWFPTDENSCTMTGVAVGAGMVDLEDVANTGRDLRDRGYKRVNPHFVPRILINMSAGHVSLKYGFKGVNHSVSTACTTGVHAIGDASRFIRYGDVDVMVCGGTEACVAPTAMAGFARMRALATKFNDMPHEASRPFDRNREGFVMAEGAGILVLEEREHALNRGATILGEILGYGLSADANHITAPSEDGDGAFRCMNAAVKDAGLTPNDICYINAHATSTPLGDAAESRAITRLMHGNNHQVAVSSTKGAVGHLLGAAGAVETIFTLMACRTGVFPPTLNCHEPDSEFQLNYVPLTAQKWEGAGSKDCVALSNSFGFGGTNASICVSNAT